MTGNLTTNAVGTEQAERRAVSPTALKEAVERVSERDLALLKGLAARMERTSLNMPDPEAFLMCAESKSLRTLLAALSAQAESLEAMAAELADRRKNDDRPRR